MATKEEKEAARAKARANGGTSGDGGAPAEVSAPIEQATVPLDGPQAFSYRDDTPAAPPAQETPLDVAVNVEQPVAEAPPLDILAIQDRFVGRLPALRAAREALEKIEAEHEADGDVIAAALVDAAKASRTPPVTELGGIKWRAKHDAEKRGGKLHLFEVTEHRPVQLGR